ADAGASLGLDNDLMAMRHIFAHGTGRQTDPIFMILDFLRTTDTHARSFPSWFPFYCRLLRGEPSKQRQREMSVQRRFTKRADVEYSSNISRIFEENSNDASGCNRCCDPAGRTAERPDLQRRACGACRPLAIGLFAPTRYP